MKPQAVRLVDVFLLGPFMVWAGFKAKGLPDWARAALILSGGATVWYNGRNYMAVEREKKLAGAPAIHWLIEENDPRLGIPTGRIACRAPDAGEVLTSGAWSCRLSNVTCTACRRRFFSDRAHNLHKPITD